jgi:hypothetical protein
MNPLLILENMRGARADAKPKRNVSVEELRATADLLRRGMPMGTAKEAYAQDFQPPADLLDYSAGLPGVGDVTGPMADARMFARDPELMTPGNLAMAGAGLLPFVPSVAGMVNKVGIPPEVPSIYPRHQQFQEARANAALPVEQGGLGLPPTNTARDRAMALGYGDLNDPSQDLYHGSLSSFDSFNPYSASTESFAGRGVYLTDSPEDASINYASIYGPDPAGRIERALEDNENLGDWDKLSYKLSNKSLTPRQQESVQKITGIGDNLGAVYPLRVRADEPVNIGPFRGPQSSKPFSGKDNKVFGPLEIYDEEADEYFEAPQARELMDALSVLDDMGGDSASVLADVEDYMMDGIPADRLYQAIVDTQQDLADPDTGEMVSGGVAAGEVLKALGVDTIRHVPAFGNPQLNLGNVHTIAMDPSNVRLRNAAFDPKRRDSSDLLAGYMLPAFGLGGLLGASAWAPRNSEDDRL